MSFPRSYLWWKKTQRILRIPAGGPAQVAVATGATLTTQAGDVLTTQSGSPLTVEA